MLTMAHRYNDVEKTPGTGVTAEWKAVERSKWFTISILRVHEKAMTISELQDKMRDHVRAGHDPAIVYRMGLNGHLRSNLRKLTMSGLIEHIPGDIGYDDKFRISKRGEERLKENRV